MYNISVFMADTKWGLSSFSSLFETKLNLLLNVGQFLPVGFDFARFVLKRLELENFP